MVLSSFYYHRFRGDKSPRAPGFTVAPPLTEPLNPRLGPDQIPHPIAKPTFAANSQVLALLSRRRLPRGSTRLCFPTTVTSSARAAQSDGRLVSPAGRKTLVGKSGANCKRNDRVLSDGPDRPEFLKAPKRPGEAGRPRGRCSDVPAFPHKGAEALVIARSLLCGAPTFREQTIANVFQATPPGQLNQHGFGIRNVIRIFGHVSLCDPQKSRKIIDVRQR